jgi:putative molybdopterin biosynthesis protein
VSTASEKVENNLAAIRSRRQMAASELAKRVGVSRQAIYAIEAGTYVPNTALALRLARVLQTGVEELFSLAESSRKPIARSVRATVIPRTEKLQPGQPVRLCRIDDRLIAAASVPLPWYLPSSDAQVNSGSAPGKVRLTLHQESNDLGSRLLIAGCDPAMAILARHLQPAGIDLVLLHQNSSDSLALLKKGCVHIAGTHLRDAASGQSNVDAVLRLFAHGSVAMISFATWEEGLITASGNPKRIRTVEDLARQEVSIVNRELGAGSRLLLDTHMKRIKLSPKHVRGYECLAPGHLAAAWQVKTGAADCCLATQAAARIFGLDFVPLESSRYDFVVRKQHLKSPAIQTLFHTLALSGLRRELNGAGGYDTTVSGNRIL